MTKNKSNMAESVRARLANIANQSGKPDFQSLVLQFMLERFLFRIGQSQYKKRFLLKGAMLFSLWYEMPHRTTRDIDLLAFADNDLSVMKKIFQEIAGISYDDGVIYHIDRINVGKILEKANYPGVKITIPAELAKARSNVQIDIGVGDAVTPGPVQATYPILLKEFPAPQLHTYPVYTVIAEKVHAIVEHGAGNSRMKDYLDLTVIFERESLDMQVLLRAVIATFQSRGTAMPNVVPVGMTDDFANDPAKQIMWSAFLRKNQLPQQSFQAIVKILREKLQPVLDAVSL